jgi:hypothetical protein
MRKYIILFFSVILFLSACGNATPDGVINKDDMVAVLTDVHITDGRMLNMSQAADTLYKYGRGRYQAIFQKYHTDSTQFKKSYRYYAVHPAELTLIYDKVLKNLQAKSDSLSAVLKKQNPQKSSSPAIPTQSPAGGAPPPLQTSSRGAYPPNNPAVARERFERMQAKRDSMIKLRNNKK